MVRSAPGSPSTRCGRQPALPLPAWPALHGSCLPGGRTESISVDKMLPHHTGDMYVAVARSPPASTRGHSIPGLQAGQQCLPRLSHSGGESAGEPKHWGNSTVPHHTLPEPPPEPVWGCEQAPDFTVAWDEFLGNIHQGPGSSPFVPSRWSSIRTHEGQCVVSHDRTSPAERLLHQPLVRPVFGPFFSSIRQGVLIRQSGRQGTPPHTGQCRPNHPGHQSEFLCRGRLVRSPGAGAGGAVASGDFLFSRFSCLSTLPSHFFLSLVFKVCTSPCPVLILPPIGLVVQEFFVGESILIQRVHLLTNNPPSPNHRQVSRVFNWDSPRWRVAVFESHIMETGVYSPADRVLGGVSALPLQPAGPSMVDVAALYVHHITIECIRLPGDDEVAPFSWTNIPGDTAAWKAFQCARYSSSVME